MNATDNDMGTDRERRVPRRIGVRRVSGVLLATMLLLAACGGSSDNDSKAPIDPDDADESDDADEPSDDAETDPVEATRPEGEWTLVSTELTRSDFAEFVPGISNVLLIRFDPDCPSGPCDLTGNPAGVNGTFDPEGEPVDPAADTEAPEPRQYVWNAVDRTYTRTREQVTGCRTETQDLVEDAYVYSTTSTLTFHAAEGDLPARLDGQYEARVDPNPDAPVEECTGYVQTGSIVGTPTGAVDIGEIDLTGEYVVTNSVIEVVPASESRAGYPAFAGTFDIEGSAITGWTGEPTELKQSGAAMNGTSSISGACSTEPETPDGYTTTESFEDLRVAALTADGDPIIMGIWTIEHAPTPAGAAGGCELGREKGFVVLVPSAALN